MVTKTLSKQTIQIKPGNILTDISVVYSELVESIKHGIRLGDNIPVCEVIPTEKLRGRIPSDIFKKIISSAEYILKSGNHRAAAYYDLESLIPAEIADISTIQEYVDYLNSRNIQFRNVRELARLEQRGALKQRINAGKFYRTN